MREKKKQKDQFINFDADLDEAIDAIWDDIAENGIDRKRLSESDIAELYNPNHYPAGSSRGGQFAPRGTGSGEGGGEGQGRVRHRDLHGKAMPFSTRTVIKAFDSAEKVPRQGEFGDTRSAILHGKEYIIKEHGRTQLAREDAMREAAVAAAIKAMGFRNTSASEVFHIEHEGSHYSVQSRLHGQHLFAEEAAEFVSQRSAQRAVLAEIILGIRDRHAGNYIVNKKNHTIQHIDNSVGLNAWTAVHQGVGFQIMLIHQSNRNAPIFDRKLVQSVYDRRHAILASVSHHDSNAVRDIDENLAHLGNALKSGKPLTLAELRGWNE